jgi:hypothetical protein
MPIMAVYLLAFVLVLAGVLAWAKVFGKCFCKLYKTKLTNELNKIKFSIIRGCARITFNRGLF